MCLTFSSESFPSQSQYFGFLQTETDPSIKSVIHTSSIKCRRCGSYLLPIESDINLCKCPFCSPDECFFSKCVQIGSGTIENRIICFVFDVTFSIEYIQHQLEELCKKMDENQSAIIVAVSDYTTILYRDEMGLPYFVTYDDIDLFVYSDLYKCSKGDITSVIIPALSAVFTAFRSCKEKSELCLTLPLLICTQTCQEDVYSIIFVIKREPKVLTVGAARKLGEIISNGGKNTIHFGSAKAFKLLTAIAGICNGLVFYLNEKLGSPIPQLMKISRRTKVKVFFPSFIGILLSTGLSNKSRKNQYINKIEALNFHGISALLSNDLKENYEWNNVNILEVSETRAGKIIRLHRFKKDGAFNASIHIEILRKCATSSILKQSWGAKKVNDLIKNAMSQDYAKGSCLMSMGVNPDIDVLKMYYILCHCGTEKEYKDGEIPSIFWYFPCK